jgi:hypothetical protein
VREKLKAIMKNTILLYAKKEIRKENSDNEVYMGGGGEGRTKP